MTNPGVYTYTLTSTENNCEGPADTVTLTIYDLPPAPIANNEAICEGDIGSHFPSNDEKWKDANSNKNIEVKRGRYGFYVTNGEVNVSLKNGENNTITLDEAIEKIQNKIM